MKPRILLPLLSCLALSARAANFTEDFETRPNATFQWTAGNALTSGFASWNFTGGTAQVLTEQSVSGDQSLRFAAGPTGPSDITQPVTLSSGGGGTLS